jgi:hypothetical protein
MKVVACSRFHIKFLADQHMTETTMVQSPSGKKNVLFL